MIAANDRFHHSEATVRRFIHLVLEMVARAQFHWSPSLKNSDLIKDVMVLLCLEGGVRLERFAESLAGQNWPPRDIFKCLNESKIGMDVYFKDPHAKLGLYGKIFSGLRDLSETPVSKVPYEKRIARIEKIRMTKGWIAEFGHSDPDAEVREAEIKIKSADYSDPKQAFVAQMMFSTILRSHGPQVVENWVPLFPFKIATFWQGVLAADIALELAQTVLQHGQVMLASGEMSYREFLVVLSIYAVGKAHAENRGQYDAEIIFESIGSLMKDNRRVAA